MKFDFTLPTFSPPPVDPALATWDHAGIALLIVTFAALFIEWLRDQGDL
jgi:hypothetical protein